MYPGLPLLVEAGTDLINGLGVECVLQRIPSGVNVPTLTVPQVIQVAVGEYAMRYIDKDSFTFLSSDAPKTGDKVTLNSVTYTLDKVVFNNGVVVQLLGDLWTPV